MNPMFFSFKKKRFSNCTLQQCSLHKNIVWPKRKFTAVQRWLSMNWELIYFMIIQFIQLAQTTFCITIHKGAGITVYILSLFSYKFLLMSIFEKSLQLCFSQLQMRIDFRWRLISSEVNYERIIEFNSIVQ